MLVRVYQSARCYLPGDHRRNNLRTSNLTQCFSFLENDHSFEIKAFRKDRHNRCIQSLLSVHPTNVSTRSTEIRKNFIGGYRRFGEICCLLGQIKIFWTNTLPSAMRMGAVCPSYKSVSVNRSIRRHNPGDYDFRNNRCLRSKLCENRKYTAR